MNTTLRFSRCALTVDWSTGRVVELGINGTPLAHGTQPALFRLGLRNKFGAELRVDALQATNCSVEQTTDGWIARYEMAHDLMVKIAARTGDALDWRIQVENHGDLQVEWVEPLQIALEPLATAGGIGREILFPYNEGARVTDLTQRETSWFPYSEPEYPSLGRFAVFPNMVFAQFLAYLTDQGGLYLGAHDPARGVKGIDFRPFDDSGRVEPMFRLYCGAEPGADWAMDYPMIVAAVGPDWTDAASYYRNWFESALPPRVRKIVDNPDLLDWYRDSPIVVTCPVRGIHDMDEMTPNGFSPYRSACPPLDEIRHRTHARLLVLLMHWEGTAPWAPPYVWPPFGGTGEFYAFRDTLHASGDLLGVYCSGFGYTEQSNLIDSYNCETTIERDHLLGAMCAAPGGKVLHSRICTGQRSGYDICPACARGAALLQDAYAPLFGAVDYAQILDQNHGGGQYFCYSDAHGHAPAPGPWMTSSMQHLLSGWNKQVPKMLFGCESSAAEPFIGNLQFSDNRFELNYQIGQPVPLYAFLYHEYVRNFMGNQCCCPLPAASFPMRMAYAFTAGDCLTLILNPNGGLMGHWGTRDFDPAPDWDSTLDFARNMIDFYNTEARPFLSAGRMIAPHPIVCETVDYPILPRSYAGSELSYTVTVPKILSTAWESGDERVQILVNYTDSQVDYTMDGTAESIMPFSAKMVRL